MMKQHIYKTKSQNVFFTKSCNFTENTSRSGLFTENLLTSHGPYGHFHKDGLAQIQSKSWVGKENVDIWGPLQNGRTN